MLEAGEAHPTSLSEVRRNVLVIEGNDMFEAVGLDNLVHAYGFCARENPALERVHLPPSGLA